MAILGLTHDENGTAFEKLPITIKVAIGEGPEPGNGHPRRLDHFVFKRKSLRGQDVVWEPAADISQVHGEKPTELGIIFLNDDPREVFRTEYALWVPGGCKCRGELVQVANDGEIHYEMRATRKTQRHPEGECWPGNYKYVDGPKKGQPVERCGEGCPDLAHGACKPSGDLYFILEKFPTFGAICRLHTSSYRSIRNLSNGLMQIRRWNRGSLGGIQAILKASPEKVSYSDRDGTRHTSVAYILSLEIGGTDLRTLVANMTEPARLLSEGPPTVELARGAHYVVHETDAERAKEITREFYSGSNAASERSECAARSSGQSDQDEQLARICELARRAGHDNRRVRMVIGQWARNLAGLERQLLNELDEQPDSARRATGGRSGSGKQPGEQLTQNAPRVVADSSQPSHQSDTELGFLF